MEATTDWTEGTVGNNSLGRSPSGRSQMGSDDRALGIIAWGELRWEGAIRKRRQGG